MRHLYTGVNTYGAPLSRLSVFGTKPQTPRSAEVALLTNTRPRASYVSRHVNTPPSQHNYSTHTFIWLMAAAQCKPLKKKLEAKVNSRRLKRPVSLLLLLLLRGDFVFLKPESKPQGCRSSAVSWRRKRLNI